MMLQKAVQTGLINGGGFKQWSQPKNHQPRDIPTKGGVNLAHGANTLFDGAPGMLRIAADIINHLFAKAP